MFERNRESPTTTSAAAKPNRPDRPVLTDRELALKKFVSGHFANWEAMPMTLHAAGLRTAAVYRAANNPLVDRTIIERRAEVMTRHLIPKGKRGGRQLVAAVRDGLNVCMLIDQKLNDGIEVPFLGVPAMTAPAAARVALRSGLPVIPLQIVREPGVRFTITVHPPLDAPRTGDQAADTRALTVAINGAIGGFVREHPGQWLWFHRRWPKAAYADLQASA